MKITKRQLRRIIKEEKAKLQEISSTDAGIAAARHAGGRPDYSWLAEQVEESARALEQLYRDAHWALVITGNQRLADDFLTVVKKASQLADTFKRHGGD